MVGSLQAICTLTCYPGSWHLPTKGTPEAPSLPKPCHVKPIHQDIHVISQIPQKVDVTPSLVRGANLSLCSEYCQESFENLWMDLSCTWLESTKYPAVTGAADKAVTSRLYL